MTRDELVDAFIRHARVLAANDPDPTEAQVAMLRLMMQMQVRDPELLDEAARHLPDEAIWLRQLADELRELHD